MTSVILDHAKVRFIFTHGITWKSSEILLSFLAYKFGNFRSIGLLIYNHRSYP